VWWMRRLILGLGRGRDRCIPEGWALSVVHWTLGVDDGRGISDGHSTHDMLRNLPSVNKLILYRPINDEILLYFAVFALSSQREMVWSCYDSAILTSPGELQALTKYITRREPNQHLALDTPSSCFSSHLSSTTPTSTSLFRVTDASVSFVRLRQVSKPGAFSPTQEPKPSAVSSARILTCELSRANKHICNVGEMPCGGSMLVRQPGSEQKKNALRLWERRLTAVDIPPILSVILAAQDDSQRPWLPCYDP